MDRPKKYIFVVALFFIAFMAAEDGSAQKPKATPTPKTREQQLMEAIENSDYPAFQKLVAGGVNLKEAKNDEGVSAFIYAADQVLGDNGYKILQAIIDAGANIAVEGPEALRKASAHEDSGTVKILIKAGVDVKARNEAGETALFGASSDNIKLLVEAGLNPNDTDSEHYTPLFGIVGPEQTAALIAAGAKVNVANDNGDTPLMDAASFGDEERINLLLAAGADINAKNKKGETALSMALRNQRINPETKRWPQVVKLLRSKGAIG
jgi:ankyrin repeat protein